VPTITRARSIGAKQEAIWEVVSDPERFLAWWPGVQRVEEVSAGAWTAVFRTDRGKTVRADYSLVESSGPDRLSWRHEVEESPFERILSESVTELELESEGEAHSRVTLRTRLRLRGFSRFGSFQIRRATAKQLTGALDGLDELLGEGS
jgi:carbon monoxide dehydrogenase subunit G